MKPKYIGIYFFLPFLQKKKIYVPSANLFYTLIVLWLTKIIFIKHLVLSPENVQI